MASKSFSYWRDRLAQATTALEAARATAMAARVPDDDIDTGRHGEPIAVSGWYEQRTISGRPAWRRCDWRDGRLHEEAPTYDPEAERALGDASMLHYEATQDYEMNHPASRR